jgi:site-specific DNA recombinase
MLRNPIYTGNMIWNGVYYKGKHNPILSRETFERVQSLLEGNQRPRGKRREFAFRGLLKCGHCGCSITAEIKKGRYIYYRCTKGRGECPERPLREERLAVLLGEPLKRLRITEERLAWIKQALKESFQDEKKYKAQEIARLQAEYEDLERRINKLYEDKQDGVVPEKFWKSKYQEYLSRQNRVEERITEHKKASVNYLEDGNRILELAQKAYSLYVNQNSFEQRKLLDLLLSNSILKDGTVISELRKPFDTLADGAIEEERLAAQKVPFSERNEIWLPKSNPLHEQSQFLGLGPGL